MKIVAFVPIKLNNERLPNKNIKSFTNGLPLISYILNTLREIDIIDEIYVYCSNPMIKEFLPNDVIYLKRNENLDLSTTKINEVISSFITDVESDVYLLTHATAPFIKSSSIKTGLDKILFSNHDSALSVLPLQEFLWKNNEPFNYDPASIPRTQDLDVIYSETSGFYAFKKDLFIEHNRRVGFKPYLVNVSKIEAVDIDVEEDFIIADSIYNSFKKGD